LGRNLVVGRLRPAGRHRDHCCERHNHRAGSHAAPRPLLPKHPISSRVAHAANGRRARKTQQ
jgi:hypothetical protein